MTYRKYLAPVPLVTDDRLNLNTIGMYVCLLSISEDGKHVNINKSDLCDIAKVSHNTLDNYINELVEFGYIKKKSGHGGRVTSYTLLVDNYNFSYSDSIPNEDFRSLELHGTPQDVFNKAFYVDIPEPVLKRLNSLNLPNEVVNHAILVTAGKKDEFTYYDYNYIVNYFIKIATNWNAKGLRTAEQIEEYQRSYWEHKTGNSFEDFENESRMLDLYPYEF